MKFLSANQFDLSLNRTQTQRIVAVTRCSDSWHRLLRPLRYLMVHVRRPKRTRKAPEFLYRWTRMIVVEQTGRLTDAKNK